MLNFISQIKKNPLYIKDRLINEVKPGDIILLHDGRGAKNAPERTARTFI